MNSLVLAQAEYLKTKKSAVRRVAIVSPLCLAVLAIVQQGYFSLNLFNWFYVVFLPATLALISAAEVNLDYGKTGLRALRSLPVSQQKIWTVKLFVVAGYAFCSCLLLSVAVVIIPQFLQLLGTVQSKPLGVPTILAGIAVMFITTSWQVPLCFILAKKLGLVFTVITHLFVSFSGVFFALKPFWFLCPWAWVNRCLVSVIGVLPNGLPVENTDYISTFDVALGVGLSLILTAILGKLAIVIYARTEAR